MRVWSHAFLVAFSASVLVSTTAVISAACGSSSTAASSSDSRATRANDSGTNGDANTSDANGTDAAVDPCGPLTTSWTRCAANPLARAGFQQPDGRYEISIGDPDVQLDTTTNVWRAWWSTTLNAHYTDPNAQLGIKYATSADGVAWNVQPALTIASRQSTTDWDTLKLETPSVLILPQNPPDRRYLLFYSGAGITKTVKTSATTTATVTWYQIGLAFSADGTTFTRLPASESPYATAVTPYGNVEGLVLLGRDAFPGLANVADGSVADPEIAFDGTTLHLFFSSLAVDDTGTPLAYGLGHATSTDGIHWTPASGNGVGTFSGGKGPSVVRAADGSWEMFFQRDSATDLYAVPSTFNAQLGIWRATSTDLTSWTVGATRDLTWDGTISSETYGWIAVGDMTLVGGQHRYYYPAFSALSPPSPDWVVPIDDGGVDAGVVSTLIVLDMARHD